MARRWPRRLVPHSEHYLAHKVAKAEISDDDLCLAYEDGVGGTYAGPVYPKYVGWHRRLVAARILAENAIPHVGAIKYVVARHGGPVSCGSPMRLLTSDEELSDLVTRAARVSVDAIGLVVEAFNKDEELLRAIEDDADPPLVAGTIVGWRLWEVSPKPSSTHQLTLSTDMMLGSYVAKSGDDLPYEWNAKRTVAQCVRYLATSRHHREPPPVVHCSCGLYAFSQFQDCVKHGLDQLNYRGPGTQPLVVDRVVVGRVLGWGKVVEHENGFRAQFARPLPPFLVAAENADLAIPLARIGIRPVMGVDRKQWTAPNFEAQAMSFLRMNGDSTSAE